MKTAISVLSAAVFVMLAGPALAGHSTPKEREITRQLNLDAAQQAKASNQNSAQQVAAASPGTPAQSAPAAAPTTPVESAPAADSANQNRNAEQNPNTAQ